MFFRAPIVSIIVFISGSITGCATSTEPEKRSLDVPVPPTSTSATSDSRVDAVTASPGKAENAAKLRQLNISWELFFQAPPSQDERHRLTQEVMAWKQSDDPDALIRHSRKQRALGQFAAADVSIRMALRLDANHQEALIEAATLAVRSKNYEDAFAYLSKIKAVLDAAKELDSAYIFRYRYVLGLAELGHGDREEGIRILTDLIRLDRGFSPGYAALAALYLEEGKLDAAEFIAKRGLDRGKPLASLHNTLGVIAKRRGDHQQARQQFEAALKAAENYTPAIVNLAVIAIILQEYETAEANLTRALALEPSNAEVYVTLGILQRRTGREDTARTAFARALEIQPEHANARFNLGVLVANDEDKQGEALRLFHEVSQLPSTDAALQQLSTLYIEDLQRRGSAPDKATTEM